MFLNDSDVKKGHFLKKISNLQQRFEKLNRKSSENQDDQRKFRQLEKKIEHTLMMLNAHYTRNVQFFHVHSAIILQKNNQGLTPARIQKFHQFIADESLDLDRCGVCLEDLEIGRRMMRLNCDGQHIFCQGCVENWFTNHKTCPNCRHIFV